MGIMQADLERVRRIFLAAAGRANPEEREAFLREACGGDAALRRQVEVQLHAQEQGGLSLEKPATEGVPTGACTPDAEPDGPAASAGDGAADLRPLCEGPGTRLGPYKLLQQIGEGGMGVVFLAEQTEPVQRRLALKVIKPGMDSRQVIARFEAERQALALMDHPHIAKVFDAGTTDSGRPYFVMELVKGVPITQFCDSHRLTPAERLVLFVPVCQAVQHAHHKGVIHRDLKPSNVLVALYDGRPAAKVIDFGVAKAMAGRLTPRTLFTDFGAVVGTLEYMSPEQAELNQLDIDTRSDVYALGVLLYELLTGSTPLERKRLKEAALLEALRRIREEEPPRPSTRLSTTEELPSIAARRGLEPRKLSGLVRGDLDWIVMKCLEKDRTRRYESANALAADLERYLHDEPVLATPPSAAYRLRKFVRRHQAGLRVAAAALLLLLLAAGGGAWEWYHQVALRSARAERRAETAKTVSVALARAEELARQAQGSPAATGRDTAVALVVWQRAEDALAPAAAALRTGEADDDLRRGLAEMAARLADARQRAEQQHAHTLGREKLLRDLDEARMARVSISDNWFDYAGVSAKYAAALAGYGLEVKAGGHAAMARRIRAEEPAVREAVIVALDDWASCAVAPGAAPSAADLLEIARTADDDPWRQEYREAVQARDATALVRLSAAARRRPLPPGSVALLAMALRGNGRADEAVALLRAARTRYPGDFWIAFRLGHYLGEVKDEVNLEERIGCYRVAAALRPEASVVHNNLGATLSAKKELDEAIVEYRKAIALDPKYATPHDNLGNALVARRQLDAAIAEYHQAIKLNPRHATAHFNLGTALREKNQLDEAIAEFRRAIALGLEDARPHRALALALYDTKEMDEAITEFRHAIRLDPKDAVAHGNLGNALHAKKLLHEALAEYRITVGLAPRTFAGHFNLAIALQEAKQLHEAIAELRAAITIDPNQAAAHFQLGLALFDTNQLEESAAAYRTASALDPKSCMTHNNLGNTLKSLRRLDEAIAEYHKGISLDPTNTLVRHNLGLALVAKGQRAEAIVTFRTVIDLDPKHVLAHHNLGVALREDKRLDEAIAAFHTAIRFDPKFAPAHHELGITVYRQGHLEKALAAFRRAIALDPIDAPAHNSLGVALYDKKQWDEAAASFRRAIALDAKYVMAQANLGNALRASQHLEEAIAAYRRALALDPRYAPAHFGLGLALHVTRQLPDAIAAYRRAIALDPTHADAHYSLGLALHDNKQLDEATAEYRKAIALNPRDARAHNNLGNVLRAKKHLDEAIAEFRKAIALEPRQALVHNNLGNTLYDKRLWDEAIAAQRQALALDPNFVQAHFGLGNALYAKGQLDQAIAAYRQALALDPRLARAHNNLGVALEDKRQLDEAIAEFRKALALDPQDARAHNNFGRALLACGRFADARASTRTALGLLGPDHPSRPAVAGQLARCERLLTLEGRVAEVLAGNDTPVDNRDWPDLIEVCRLQRRHADAARLSRAAFKADPKLADDLKAAHRYNAACCAALTAAGQGKDAVKVEDNERVGLRKEALDWLRADLAAWGKLVESGQPAARAAVQRKMRHWQQDRDLASLREPSALAQLSPEQRTAYTQLWADVAALLQQAADQPR
jgi:tetratricopeptide (TPR) repeat protein